MGLGHGNTNNWSNWRPLDCVTLGQLHSNEISFRSQAFVHNRVDKGHLGGVARNGGILSIGGEVLSQGSLRAIVVYFMVKWVFLLFFGLLINQILHAPQILRLFENSFFETHNTRWVQRAGAGVFWSSGKSFESFENSAQTSIPKM